ncbi:MAG: hypothetical protein ABIV39_11960, partial [Verrucomicrobiota bacterium]
LEEATESEILASFHYVPRKENTDFPKILDHWSSIFPKEQLFVGFFEEITGDPQSLLRKIFTFLEVSPDVDWQRYPFADVINKNPETPMPAKYRATLEKIYANDIEELHRRFGKPVEAWRCLAKV